MQPNKICIFDSFSVIAFYETLRLISCQNDIKRLNYLCDQKLKTLNGHGFAKYNINVAMYVQVFLLNTPCYGN